MDSLFQKKKRRPNVQQFLGSKDIFWYTRIAGIVALAVTFVYWGFVRSDEHANLSRVFLASAIAFNAFYIYVYRREMKRRESEKE